MNALLEETIFVTLVTWHLTSDIGSAILRHQLVILYTCATFLSFDLSCIQNFRLLLPFLDLCPAQGARILLSHGLLCVYRYCSVDRSYHLQNSSQLNHTSGHDVSYLSSRLLTMNQRIGLLGVQVIHRRGAYKLLFC